MKKFSQFLIEETESGFITDYAVASREILVNGYKPPQGVFLNKDCSVTFRSPVFITKVMKTNVLLNPSQDKLRFRVKTMGPALSILNISTLEGLPKYGAKSDLYIKSTTLKDFEFIPEKLQSLRIDLPQTPFSGGKTEVDATEVYNCFNNSLTGISKVITSARRISIYQTVTHGFLNVLLIKNTQNMYFSVSDEDARRKSAEAIFNRHLAGDRDILDCQEELIKSGLKEFARL